MAQTPLCISSRLFFEFASPTPSCEDQMKDVDIVLNDLKGVKWLAHKVHFGGGQKFAEVNPEKGEKERDDTLAGGLYNQPGTGDRQQRKEDKGRIS